MHFDPLQAMSDKIKCTHCSRLAHTKKSHWLVHFDHLVKKMSDKIIKNSRKTAYITALFTFKGQLTFALYACGLWLVDFDPFCEFLWARSIQPKFPKISVQNSMDRFGPTGKVSKKRVHLLRWTTFPGRTSWNFGWMDRALCFKVRCLWL